MEFVRLFERLYPKARTSRCPVVVFTYSKSEAASPLRTETGVARPGKVERFSMI
jgi:hypothetical protein